MKFEIYQQRSLSMMGNGEWRWRLRANNGEIIAHGESYTTQANCLHAIGLVKGTTAATPVYNAASGQLVPGA